MTARSRRWRTIAGLFAGALLATLMLAGCSSRGDTTGSAAPAGDPALDRSSGGQGADAAAPEEAAPGAAGAPNQDPQRAPARIEALERSLIYTASTTVRVENVVQQADRAVDIAIGAGGVVGGDRRTLDSDRSEAQLVLRVPADKFSTTLNELARLGVEESRAVQTEDVTEAVVDLDARLATQRASVARVRALLERARTIGEVVSIESELARREAELASLEQRKERLAGLVALSTITLNLRGPAAPDAPDEPDTGFVAGLKAGWDAFLASIKVVLTVAGWLLPWALAIGLPVWLLFFLLRRRRRVGVGPAAPLTAGAPATTPPTTDQS